MEGMEEVAKKTSCRRVDGGLDLERILGVVRSGTEALQAEIEALKTENREYKTITDQLVKVPLIFSPQKLNIVETSKTTEEKRLVEETRSQCREEYTT